MNWEGRFRPALTGQGVYPRPYQPEVPIYVGVGGTPASFARAGRLGLPLMVAIIGGQTHRFKPLAGCQSLHQIAQQSPASLATTTTTTTTTTSYSLSLSLHLSLFLSLSLSLFLSPRGNNLIYCSRGKKMRMVKPWNGAF